MDYVIGCDLGSQGIKVILLTAEGRLAGEASVGYDIDYPHPTWAEQPVSRWTGGHVLLPCVKLLQDTGVQPDQIRAIGLDAQVDGVVPIDAAGEPLRPGDHLDGPAGGGPVHGIAGGLQIRQQDL